MKLLSLYIEKYKNIKKQTFDFSNNSGYIALIGLNGSGKSNLLEAIGLIFHGLFNKKKIPFAYEIEYEHDGKTYLRKPRISMIDGTKVKNSNMFYPSSVIACYSGEDLRLWHLAFEDYYMHYFKKAINNKLFSPELVYINKYCWNIALLSLLCSEKDNVKRFLKDTFNIDNLDNVKVKFSFGNPDSFKNHIALSWIKRIQKDCLDKGGQASMKSILSYDVPLFKQSKEKTLFDHLYLLSQPQKNSAKGNNVEKYITEINIENDGISFDNYSEGHKKLILIECITQILGDESSLILLDEPDAHVHIAIKKDILELVANYKGQSVMTTHSPMFLNKRWDGYNENNIYYISNGRIENSDPLKHLSELTNNNVDYFEGAFILSSKKILVVEGKYDDKYLKKAIGIFSKKDSKYKKLDDVAIFSANSASAAEVIYDQIISPCLDKMEEVVFLFDYDDAGWRDGWKKIKVIHDTNPKVIPMFYQDNYSSTLYPTSDSEINKENGSKCIKSENSYMVEDLFSENAYASVISQVISARRHKDFRKINFGKKGTAGAIKEYIENNYATFDDTYYAKFKSVLDKLLELFNL